MFDIKHDFDTKFMLKFVLSIIHLNQIRCNEVKEKRKNFTFCVSQMNYFLSPQNWNP